MSVATSDRVLAELAFLGLDTGALQVHSAQVEIDRFDHWMSPTGRTAATITTGCGCSFILPVEEVA